MKSDSDNESILDQELLFQALKGLELILRDSKQSAISVLTSYKTNNTPKSQLPKILKKLEILLSLKFEVKIRKQVCIVLGSLSILLDTGLVKKENISVIQKLLNKSLSDNKRAARNQAAKANCEWQLCLAGV